jgi:hypothetical protein
MGDATPEDVIAEFIAGEVGYGPTDGMVEQARELRAALAAAGYEVNPAGTADRLANAEQAVQEKDLMFHAEFIRANADVDAAARLRDAIREHESDTRHSVALGLLPDVTPHDEHLWAAVGSVDPETKENPDG